jgi:hypothetical protein
VPTVGVTRGRPQSHGWMPDDPRPEGDGLLAHRLIGDQRFLPLSRSDVLRVLFASEPTQQTAGHQVDVAEATRSRSDDAATAVDPERRPHDR